MTFTALHRAAGAAPGPITDALLDQAIDAGAAETDDLDWKEALPPAKNLSGTDFPKDVAAMANSGGGVIVYGVQEKQKIPTARVDVGDLEEVHERALRACAVSAISPPVFGLGVHALGQAGRRAVVVEVPGSADGPHLIYRGEYFGAPIRNDADTHWMKERQLEAMYRVRFDERRRSTEALDGLYEDAAAGRTTADRAWLIAVAHPRVPRFTPALSREQASKVFEAAANLGQFYGSPAGIHPLQSVHRFDPQTGLRRWIAINAATDSSAWKESWAAVHADGSVSLATRIGGHRSHGASEYFDGNQVEAVAIESAVADAMALVHKVAAATGNGEYDIRVGIEWVGYGALQILGQDRSGYAIPSGLPSLPRYVPVEKTVDAADADADFYWDIHDLALDCVNQGGVERLRRISPPARGQDDATG